MERKNNDNVVSAMAALTNSIAELEFAAKTARASLTAPIELQEYLEG